MKINLLSSVRTANYFSAKSPENLIEIGETISPKDLTSISELPYDVQKKIINQYTD